MSASKHVNPDPPLDRQAVREAAHWLMRLGSTHASAADVSACDQWRADNAEHERAWQRAQRLNKTFGLIPQGIGMATLERPPSASRRNAFKTLAALLIASPMAWASWNAAPVVRWRSDYRTDPGEQREWRLADGSRLWLNTASALDQRLTHSEHELWLREGEMYVQAAHQHPPSLQIQTRLGRIHAEPSSRLSVRISDQQCIVNVMAGQARIQPAAHTRHVNLTATQQAVFDANTVYPPQPIAAHEPDWLRGTLCADAMRLDHFVAEISRYRPGIIRCDPSIAALQLSGTFQLDNTDSILRALPTLLPIQVDYRTSYWVTLRPAHKHA